jgi:rRNA maturation protein Nop10
MLNIVTIKFIAPNNDEIDVKCNEKIARSTLIPECDCIPDKGGYTVHPVPAPFSTKALLNKQTSAGGYNQNDILFKRAKLISEAPIISGTK